jgi:MFS family permease
MAAGCVTVNLTGNSVTHFWLALVMLGIAWNFLFVGATTLLAETYLPEEKAKTQALNDFLVYTTITLSALSAGFLQHTFGWRIVNLGVLPAIGLILAAIFWLKLRRKVSVTATA